VQAYEAILNASKPTVWDIFEQGTKMPGRTAARLDPRDPVHHYKKWTDGALIHLIPSQLELAFSLKNPGNKERHLSRVIREIEGDYDLILIDCAPTESVLTTAAYLSSDWLLVPVKPEYLSTIGLPLLVNSMRDFKTEHEDNVLELAGVVFNAASDYLPEEALAKEGVRKLAKKYGWHVFGQEVEYSRSYPKGAREGLPIFRTSYSRSWKVKNFELFAEEFAKRIGL